LRSPPWRLQGLGGLRKAFAHPTNHPKSDFTTFDPNGASGTGRTPA
jgi:hypothetical protein